MKICFISLKAYQLFNPDVKSTFGGAEVQMSLLAKEFAKRSDLEIQLMVADYGQQEKERIENVCIWKSINFKKNILAQFIQFFKVFNRINANIYIQRSLTPQSGLIALYCKLRRKKLVYMVSSDRETDGKHEIFDNPFKSYLASLVFKFASKVFVQNDYQMTNVLKRCSKKPILLNSSYEISDRNNEKKDFILWVGRSEVLKRPTIFIDFANRFVNEKFVMICPPSTNNPALSGKLKSIASSVSNLTFYEFIPFNEINEFFSKAKLFINTSIIEGFPNTFIQAAMNKTPIVSLNVNPNDMFNNYKIGFFCNNDMSELFSKTEEILMDTETYKMMQENIYRYAKENHDIKVNASKLLEIVVSS